ncbi:MAG: hypothetical protein M0Q15_15975 [Nevskia sp.]|nr:hypothetical protein [Nevskia sp.]
MQTLIQNDNGGIVNEFNVLPAVQNESPRHFIKNDRGGITYVSQQPFGTSPFRRTDSLADVRVLVDAMKDLIAAHRAFWPNPYPVPEDVHCALLGADYALARVRGGTLRQFSEEGDQ